MLSRPHIVAMDNQEAQIQVVDDVPYVTGTSTSIAGQVTTQVAREEVGITLQVTPQINPDGYVRMEINQEVSDFTDSTVAVGPGVNAPVFFRRLAETTVTVRDGETIVLGGLITSRKENSETKVPIVGDVPILGALFRSQDDQVRQTELLVILTPRVIRSVEDFRENSLVQRDRTGTLPIEVLTNPLMNRLQVDPEELRPPENEGAFGPFRRPTSEEMPYSREFPPAGDLPIRPRRDDLPAAPEVNRRPTYDLPLPASYRVRSGA